jgi:hypothetical protein
MHLGIYRFEGEPQELLPAYDRLLAMIPAGNITWHLCAVEPGGIVIYDTCPTEAAFTAFSSGPDFAAAVRAAGLPEASVTGFPVHVARTGELAG